MNITPFDSSTRLSLQNPLGTHPYASSIASSASSSTSSVFSADGLSSQSSAPSSSKSSLNAVWEPEHGVADFPSEYLSSSSADACNSPNINLKNTEIDIRTLEVAVAPELRQHPRRTQRPAQIETQVAGLASTAPRPPPSLVRQCERKDNFVESLVDTTTQMIEVIWPLSVISCSRDTVLGGKNLIGLRTFIQEVLKRSKTSYSTLQVALYYLVLIKPFVPRHDFTMEQFEDSHASRAMQCGRRMFLAALILASKYLQDRNYSARAWSKISGLKVYEINTNEMAFVTAVDWKLHVPEPVFQRWTDVVLKYSSTHSPLSALDQPMSWKSIVPRLTPELDNLDFQDPLHKSSTPKISGIWPAVDCKDAFGSPTKGLFSSPYPHAQPFGSTMSPCSASSEQTPTNIKNLRQILEPTPRECPLTSRRLPPLPFMGPLPTPQMTPQVSNFSTPAVSASGLCSRRPSMSFAMKQLQNASMARTTLDQWRPISQETLPSLNCRSSFVQSASSLSSPESMLSDTSSRSSRASSISSVVSSNCALPQPRLAVQATRRCANMQLSGIKENERPVIRSPSVVKDSSWDSYTSSPDCFSGGTHDYYHKAAIVHPQTQRNPNLPITHDLSDQEAAEGLRDLALNRPRTLAQPQATLNRKRERPVSMELQQTVRAAIKTHCLGNLTNQQCGYEDDGSVLPDARVADSFLLYENPKLPELKGLANGRNSATRESDCTGRKRVCCVEEMPMTAGPGMWAGII